MDPSEASAASVVFAVLFLIFVPGPALALTELERFELRVNKSAPQFFDETPPVLRVCQDTVNARLVGQLFSVTTTVQGVRAITVFCALFGFDLATGLNVEVFLGNCIQWAMLATILRRKLKRVPDRMGTRWRRLSRGHFTMEIDFQPRGGF